ncbi:MAG: TIM barrel protein [Bacilli bacterium]|jgi:sugar phosphate isomerase/epimerase|nr:TIM barrel protein [Bacilli bacterium]
MNIGINSFGLAKNLTSDFRGTLKSLKEAGVNYLEPCLVFDKEMGLLGHLISSGLKKRGLSGGIFMEDEAQDKIRLVRESGINVLSAHLFLTALKPETLSKIADKAIIFAKENKIEAYVLSFGRPDKKLALKFLEAWREPVQKMTEAGIKVLFHNHGADLEGKEGETIFHTFLEGMPYMGAELDVGWVMASGKDPLEIMKKYAPRIQILHFKDIKDLKKKSSEKDYFVPAGEGVIPLDQILLASKELPLLKQGLVLDQDRSDGDFLFDTYLSAQNLQKGAKTSLKIRKEASLKDGKEYSILTFPLLRDTFKGKISYFAFLPFLKAAGLSQVDLLIPEIKHYGVEKTLKALKDNELHVGCLIAYLDLYKLKGKKLDQAFLTSLKLCQNVQASYLMVVPKKIFSLRKNKASFEEIRSRYILGFRRGVELAEKFGITVCFEDTPSIEIPLSSSSDCLAILKEVKGLKLVFDTGNMLPALEKPLDFYEATKEYICRVHLKETIYMEKGDLCLDGRRMQATCFGCGDSDMKVLIQAMEKDKLPVCKTIEFVMPVNSSLASYQGLLSRFVIYLNNLSQS